MARQRTKKTRPAPRHRPEAPRNPLDPGFEPANKGRRYPPEVLTEEEVTALIRACSRRAPTGIRNRAIIVVLWRAQLRVSEALALTPKDLDGDRGTVRILHGKGDRTRTVGLDDGAVAILEKWLVKRRSLGFSGKGSRPLLCTLAGDRLDPSYVRRMLKRMAQRAGIAKRVHPHGLRHTGASELRSEGIEIGVISKQLGHRSIATTSRYLDHINPKVVIETMRKRSWSAGSGR